MTIEIITAPFAEPMHREEIKTDLRYLSTDLDAAFDRWITSARDRLETDTVRQLVISTVDFHLDRFPKRNRDIEIPIAPLDLIESLKYVDQDGVQQTFAAASYDVDATSEPGRVAVAWGVDWPSTRKQHKAVTLRAKIGHLVPFTVVASTEVLTWQGKTPVDGLLVRLSNSGGALPAGLSNRIDYFIVETSGDTCKLSLTSGGAAVDVTGLGTGSHFVGVLPDKIRQALTLLISDRHWNAGTMIDGNDGGIAKAYESLMYGARWGIKHA